MVASESVCGCDECGDPLCGFCTDDLYCPQCGCAVAKIFSSDAVVDSSQGAGAREIWVYPSADGFVFSLSLKCLNEDRRETVGQPEIDLDATLLEGSKWFEPQLEEIGACAGGRGTQFRMKPKAEVADLGDEWFVALEPKGELAALEVVGGFQPQEFTVRVCSKPTLDFSLAGTGVLADHVDRDTWNVWKRDVLQLELQLEAKGAPICLTRDFDRGALSPGGAFMVDLKRTLPKDTVLWPGAPVPLPLDVNSKSWPPGVLMSLEIELHGREPIQKKLQLKLKPLGDIGFLVMHSLAVQELFYGSLVSSSDDSWKAPRLEVVNSGDAPLLLPQPTVSWDDQREFSWCRVAWIGDLVDGMMYLDPGGRAELVMEIDLRDEWHGTLTDGGALRGMIVVQDDLREWKLPFFIRRISVRPMSTSWLAIDFGTTNIYAAAWDESSTTGRAQVVPALGGNNPEKYDSAMFFTSVAVPKYVIGPDAAQLGTGCPTALVRGLKRLIGLSDQNGDDVTRFVIDGAGNSADFSVPTLVRLVLRRIIRHCEDHMQRTFSRIGVSFPAKFTRERTAALKAIIDAMVADFGHEDPPRRIACAEPKLDEASAVALGFVLDRDTVKEWVEPLMTPEKRSIALASFDFGGGTIDTALLRIHFDYVANIARAKYRIEYLGIGGDDCFGGEDVTYATLQLLLFELREILKIASNGNPPELPVESPVMRQRWNRGGTSTPSGRWPKRSRFIAATRKTARTRRAQP